VSANDHSHPELEDRVTAEMTLLRTDLGAVGGRVDVVAQEVAGLREDTRRGFAAVVQAIEQLAAQMPGGDA
jgi:hypothetical protein